MSKTTKSVIEKSSTTLNIPSKEEASDALFSDDPNAPVVKSVGYARVPGKNTYISYIIYTQGTNVVKVEVDEPNLRPISEETCKLNFVNLFMNGDIE
jgi:hypothetical protein